MMDQVETITIEVEETITIDFETHFTGHKSSEGDGRTAADIEQEMEDAHGTE